MPLHVFFQLKNESKIVLMLCISLRFGSHMKCVGTVTFLLLKPIIYHRQEKLYGISLLTINAYFIKIK